MALKLFVFDRSIVQRAIILADNCPVVDFLGEIVRGAIIQGLFARGEIIQRGFPRTLYKLNKKATEV